MVLQRGSHCIDLEIEEKQKLHVLLPEAIRGIMSSFQNICKIMMHFFVCDDYKLLRNCEVLILLLLLLILHSFLKTKYISCKGQSNTMINNAFPFVIQLNCFMILMIDDYHNIHTKKCQHN